MQVLEFSKDFEEWKEEWKLKRCECLKLVLDSYRRKYSCFFFEGWKEKTRQSQEQNQWRWSEEPKRSESMFDV